MELFFDGKNVIERYIEHWLQIQHWLNIDYKSTKSSYRWQVYEVPNFGNHCSDHHRALG